MVDTDTLSAPPHVGYAVIPVPPDADLRPPLDKSSDVAEWLSRRYIITDWDNAFLERLQMILKRDKARALLPEGKAFRTERRGVCVTAISQDGKTTMVWQALKRLFNDSFTETRCGERIAYCRLRGEASVKSICKDLCRTTGYSKFPAKMTRPEASDLAVHRLRMAGITMIVIDGAHHMSDPKDVISRFLKTLAQDGGGFCVILIGTPKVRDFVYGDPENLELAERYLDLPLDPFDRETTIALINETLKDVASDVELRLAVNIKKDPYFADRIYDGLHGSFGRCMFLIVNAVIRAYELEGDRVDIEDFREIFDFKYRHFNSENPFVDSVWTPRVHGAAMDGAGSPDIHFASERVPEPPRKRGRPRKRAGTAK